MAIKGRIHILLNFSCFILMMGYCYSKTDKLMQGEQLKDGDEPLSASGKFKFGFFSLEHRYDQELSRNRFSLEGGVESSGNRYVGGWYNIIEDRSVSWYRQRVYGSSVPSPSRKVVWVANRNTPILDESASLRIDNSDGNLKIFHHAGDPIAISSVKGARNTSVTLLPSGNLVLQEIYSNGSIKQVLWQSFDYPTHVLLPGMKLGINLQTGHRWFLQSWRNRTSPALGPFAFGMDPNFTDQLIIRWFGEVEWNSGPFLNGKFKSWDVSDYNFSYTSNEQEKYFNYSVNDDVIPYPILKIDAFCSLKDDRGSELISCEGYCGQHVYSNWCGITDSSFDFKVGSMSGDRHKFKENNMTLFDCRERCYSNCSCVAFAFTNRGNDTDCEIWSREAKFIESHTDNHRTLYVEVATKEIIDWRRRYVRLIVAIAVALLVILLCALSYVARRKYRGKDEKYWLSLTVAVGIVLLIPLLCYLCYLAWRKLKAEVRIIMNRRKLLRELEDNASSSTTNNRGKTKEKDQNHELKIFNFQAIVAATDNFSTSNKLGEGGFGPVYKGKLLDAQEIAIKRLSRRSTQGIVEFKNEAKLIAKLQHTNLVKLLGCSGQGEERVLVYEYMPNKSLDFFLFDSDRKKLLDWKKRLSIIEGIAQGLIYLHKYSRLKVIHRDLKASNILLDDQMNPKISDFGMARIFAVNELEANTNRVVGTYGYMSPEYAMSGIVSMKTDVFSFGVLVLEIVSGKKNNSCYHTEYPLNLIGYAWQLWNEGKGLEVMDTALEELFSPNEVLRCVHVGLLCVQDQAADRPTISDVVSMLANETMLLPAPKQPAFFINVNSEEQEASEIKSENCSTNDVTISVMEAR